MTEIVENRRSVRRYKPDRVLREDIEAILRAGMLAPSSKNRQPWRFVVAEGEGKAAALAAMERGLARERTAPLLPGSAEHLGGAENTLRIMCAAPVVIFVLNPMAAELDASLTPEERIFEICNAQSVGAALENMTLEATALGLGSLWICDTFFAQKELRAWLNTDGELYAALALGYPDEAPPARPRKQFGEIVEWRTKQ